MFKLLLKFLITIITIVNNETSAELVTITECDSVVNNHQFVLESPGYPSNQSCEFVVKGHESCQTQFHFQFLDFELGSDQNCSQDRFVVNDVEILCGNHTGEVRMFKSVRDQLKLKLITGIHSSSIKKGFKILITRLLCNESVSLVNNFERSVFNNLTQCCGDLYKSRRFFLSSPGFPYSNFPSDCVYSIKRSNPNICRLRIHFKFFWLRPNCEEEYLEIDSRRICGCRTDLDIVSQFDQNWNDNPKIIKFKTLGQPIRQHFTGFVAEIIQDECPTRYSPSLESNRTISNKNRSTTPKFYFYNDQLNRISSVEKMVMNYFDPPLFNNERERREYFETTSTDILLPNNDEWKCLTWGMQDWLQLSQHVLWKNMPSCKIMTQEINPKCCHIQKLQGFVISPGYPFYYPNNLDCCYRFQRISGFCNIRLSVLDFNLEPSENCGKDSLTIYDKYKYCGNSLINSQFTFEMSDKNFEDIYFHSDQFYYGRGFKIYFQHLPCMDAPPPPPPPPAPMPEEKCGGEINAQYFTLNFQKINNNQQCTYIIRKFEEDVCGVELLFLNFDLLCNVEYLAINNKQYCGLLSGKRIFVLFDLYNLVRIVYQQSQTPPVLSSIVVKGQQIRGNCDPFVLDVPAERRLTLPANTTYISKDSK